MTRVNRITNTIIICFAVFLLILSMFFSGGITKCYAASLNGNGFDKTEVLDDLNTATINGKAFNILDYFSDATGLFKHPEILTVVEYCYSFREGQRDNYGLYIYFYNPQKLNIDTDSSANKITLGVKYGVDKNGNVVVEDYEKFALRFCSKSEGDYKDLFYKFKVIDHKSSYDNKTVVERVNSSSRRYDFSEVELVTVGDKNATAYGIGGTYIFEGYARGYGEDQSSESTLTCKRNDFETIELDIAGKYDGNDKRTYWRSESSSLGKNYQNQINSVFFAIDTEVLEKYGYTLQRIKAEWFETITAPVVVVNPETFYELKDYKGNMDHNYDKCLVSSSKSFGWNAPTITNLGRYINYNRYVLMLPFLFNSEEDSPHDRYISSKEFEDYLDDYDKSYVFGNFKVGNHNYSADLFKTTRIDEMVAYNNFLIDHGHKVGMNTYEFDITNPDDLFHIKDYDSTHNWFEKFFNYGLKKIDTNDGRDNVLPIIQLNDDDFDDNVDDTTIGNNLLVNKEDVKLLREFYKESTEDKNQDGKRDKEVFLFRYSQTNYYAEDIYLVDRSKVKKDAYVLNDSCGEVRQETVFLDFDILSMTFNKNGDLTTLACVMSPVDFFAELTPSNEGSVPDWFRLLKIIIGLILFIFVIVLLYPIISPIIGFIIKGILWLITLPFKAIGSLIKAKKKE